MMGVGMKGLVLFSPVVSSFLVYVKASRLQAKEEKVQLLVWGGGESDA